MIEFLDRISEGDCKLAAGIDIARVLPAQYVLKVEVKLPRGYGGSSRGARLDMAILDRDSRRILLILEVKRSPASTATAQGSRYGRMAGARVVYLRGMRACQQAGERVMSELGAGPASPG